MAEFINRIVNKIGTDKILHFMGGMNITSGTIILFNGFMPLFLLVLLGVILTCGLEIIKESYLDSYFDKLDILYTVLGSLIPLILILLNKLFIWLL